MTLSKCRMSCLCLINTIRTLRLSQLQLSMSSYLLANSNRMSKSTSFNKTIRSKELKLFTLRKILRSLMVTFLTVLLQEGILGLTQELIWSQFIRQWSLLLIWTKTPTSQPGLWALSIQTTSKQNTTIRGLSSPNKSRPKSLKPRLEIDRVWNFEFQSDQKLLHKWLTRETEW